MKKTLESPVFYVPAQGQQVPVVIDVAILRTGSYVGLYSNQTIDELRKKHPLICLGESDAVRDQKEAMITTTPTEITAEAYEYALCTLPPSGYKANSIGASFKCEEHLSGRITAIYASIQGRCFTFNGVASMPHAQIMAKVLKVIESEETIHA